MKRKTAQPKSAQAQGTGSSLPWENQVKLLPPGSEHSSHAPPRGSETRVVTGSGWEGLASQILTRSLAWIAGQQRQRPPGLTAGKWVKFSAGKCHDSHRKGGCRQRMDKSRGIALLRACKSKRQKGFGWSRWELQGQPRPELCSALRPCSREAASSKSKAGVSIQPHLAVKPPREMVHGVCGRGRWGQPALGCCELEGYSG